MKRFTACAVLVNKRARVSNLSTHCNDKYISTIKATLAHIRSHYPKAQLAR